MIKPGYIEEVFGWNLSALTKQDNKNNHLLTTIYFNTLGWCCNKSMQIGLPA